MQEDGQLNLLQAISLASGTSFQAAIGNMCVVRKLPNGQTQQISIRYRDIVKGKTLPPDLQPEDIVYVPLSKAKVILSASLLSNAAASAVIHYY
jgi:polysaccharide export outer membrane protein